VLAALSIHTQGWFGVASPRREASLIKPTKGDSMRIRTYLTAIVGASALAMAATAAQAQDATDTGSGTTMDKPSSGMMTKHSKSGVHSVSGQVQSVSEDSLTVRNKAGKDQTLTLGSDTKYTERGKQISRSDVTEGARVRATFKGSGENLHATEIRVLRTGQSASKKSGMEEKSGMMEEKGSGSSVHNSPSDETGGGTPAAGTSGTGSSNVSGGGAGAKPDTDTSTGASDAGTGSSGTGAGTENEMKDSDAGTGSSGTGTSGTDGGY
jgi:hypothetical protein